MTDTTIIALDRHGQIAVMLLNTFFLITPMAIDIFFLLALCRFSFCSMYIKEHVLNTKIIIHLMLDETLKKKASKQITAV